MLYRTLKRLIENGQSDALEEKLDLFYALDKLTEAEYQELSAALRPEKKTE